MTQIFVPYFAYANATEAMDYLERCFGFATTARYDASDGSVMHAEMALGNAAIMLGTGSDLQRAPEKLTVPPGRGIYVVVEDVDAQFERAKAGGATVVYPPEDTEFGTGFARQFDPLQNSL